jgi:glycosyltransferase involved in cell wall biosynthesis
MSHAYELAVAQDYLCAHAGGERVALTIADIFAAPIFTSLYEPRRTFATGDTDVHASWLNSFPFLRADQRRAFPLLAPTFSAMKVDAAVTICNTSGWAHGIRATGYKVAYWHSPAKWLHRPDDYQAAGSRSGQALLAVLRRRLLKWDARAVSTIHLHLASSSYTSNLLNEIYGIDARVIHAPLSLSATGQQDPVRDAGPDGYLLCVCRLLPYKNVGALLGAMRLLPAERMCIVGRGPEETRLRAGAPANVHFLGTVSEANLRWLYAHSGAAITASREDFGLTPLEAASFGRPSITLRWGGFLDTVVDGVTGVFFDDPSAQSIAAAVRRAQGVSWDELAIVAHADGFSTTAFATKFRHAVGR